MGAAVRSELSSPIGKIISRSPHVKGARPSKGATSCAASYCVKRGASRMKKNGAARLIRLCLCTCRSVQMIRCENENAQHIFTLRALLPLSGRGDDCSSENHSHTLALSLRHDFIPHCARRRAAQLRREES